MVRVNNKWVNEDAWTFHITNKDLIREVVSSKKDKDMEKLENLSINPKWLEDEGEGEPPNMMWIRGAEAAWRTKFESQIPFWVSIAATKLMALFRQDSAYQERIGGIVNYIIYNEKFWRTCTTKAAKVKFLEDIRDWWNENDERDRTRSWILASFNKLIKWYKKKPFWEETVNFLIEYTIAHKREWVPNPIYDPKIWFPRGRGDMNNRIHGGLA